MTELHWFLSKISLLIYKDSLVRLQWNISDREEMSYFSLLCPNCWNFPCVKKSHSTCESGGNVIYVLVCHTCPRFKFCCVVQHIIYFCNVRGKKKANIHKKEGRKSTSYWINIDLVVLQQIILTGEIFFTSQIEALQIQGNTLKLKTLCADYGNRTWSLLVTGTYCIFISTYCTSEKTHDSLEIKCKYFLKL